MCLKRNILPVFGFVMALLAFITTTKPAHAQGYGNTITCSSDDGRRNFCNADTRGGVQLSRQISGSACIQGQTWGWNNNQIWVDKGCRAEFRTGNGNNWGGGNGGTITCSSNDGRRNFCNANTRGGVQLSRQISGSACIQGQTWGWNNNQIWVDKGCRAEFRTGNGNGNGWGNGGGWGGNNGNTITCSSDNGRRNFCNANTRGGVQLSRQISGSACIQGQTWGWNNNQIWVDRGCRAEFVTGRGNGNGWGNGGSGTVFNCSSDDGKRNYCAIPNGANPNSITLSRQISGSACIQGQTWGADGRGVWVDRGCRAEFRTNR